MKQLLLHACCAPCTLYMYNQLTKDFDVTIYYYNPNIFPKEEYDKRKNELEKYCHEKNIKFIKELYNHQEFQDAVKGLEQEPERGKRCDLCYNLRIEKTALKAKELGSQAFATTLIMGRQKKTDKIIEIGKRVAEKTGLLFIEQDFKKQGGSIEAAKIAKDLNLYRQTYCGCQYC